MRPSTALARSSLLAARSTSVARCAAASPNGGDLPGQLVARRAVANGDRRPCGPAIVPRAVVVGRLVELADRRATTSIVTQHPRKRRLRLRKWRSPPASPSVHVEFSLSTIAAWQVAVSLSRCDSQGELRRRLAGSRRETAPDGECLRHSGPSLSTRRSGMSAVRFSVNSLRHQRPALPRIASDSLGNFVVVWRASGCGAPAIPAATAFRRAKPLDADARVDQRRSPGQSPTRRSEHRSMLVPVESDASRQLQSSPGESVRSRAESRPEQLERPGSRRFRYRC